MKPVSQLPEPRQRPAEAPVAPLAERDGPGTAAAPQSTATTASPELPTTPPPAPGRPTEPEARRPSRRALRIPWLVRDALGLYRTRIAGILALNLAGVGGAWASLGGIYLYVKHLESGRPIAVRGIVLPIGTGLSAVVLMAIALTLVGLTSALCIYATELLISQLSLVYRNRCQQRVLSIAADPGYRGWQSLVAGPPRQALTDLSRSRCIHMSLALHALLQGILPFATMVVAVAILVWTSPLLSAVLLPAVALYLVPLRAINRKTSEATEEFEAADRKARVLASDRLRTLVDEDAAPPVRRASVEQITGDPQWLRAGYYFYQRRLSDDRLHLLSTAFTVVSTAVIIVFFAATRSSHQAWASVLVYFVALRTAVGAARHASGIFVQLCRFFPIYVEYVDFVDAAERLRARRAASGGAGAAVAGDARGAVARSLTFRCAGRFDQPEADGGLIRLRRGQALVLLVPWEPTAADLEGAAAVLESHASEPADLVSAAGFVVAPAALDAALESRPALLYLERDAALALVDGTRELDDLDAFLVVVSNRAGLLMEPGAAPLRERAVGVALLEGGRLRAGATVEQLAAQRRALYDHLAERRQVQGFGGVSDLDDVDDDDGDDDD